MTNLMTCDEQRARVKLESDQIKKCRRIRITDQPIDELDKTLWASHRVLAIAEDGTVLELLTVTKVQLSLDYLSLRGTEAEATITFLRPEVDADATARIPLELLPVEPNGETDGFGCGHLSDDFDDRSTEHNHCEVVKIPTYPQTAESGALRLMRIANKLSLRDVSRFLGISVVDLSALERGLKTLSKEQWTWVLEQVAGGGR